MKKLAMLLAVLPLFVFANNPCTLSGTYTVKNDIPPRLQWNANSGYCGEVSLISAGLYYGQYVSQYDVRALISKGQPQNKAELLIGVNDQQALSQMHLNCVEWDTDDESSTTQFLSWIKQNVAKGYPVAIGVYINQDLCENDPSPDAGDSDYDHIVPVTGVASNHALTDPSYYADDVVYFSDNGIWPKTDTPPYLYCYACGPFQASREQANAKTSPPYSVSSDASNYGVAITGVMDLHGDTLPVRLATSVNYEDPSIGKNSNERPASMPLSLTITVSNLEPDVPYILYRYNNFTLVPDSEFNAHAKNAYEMTPFQITSGSTYVKTDDINSDEIAVYRAVKASAP